MMMLKIEEEKDERRSIVPKDQRVVYTAYACGRTATLEFVPYFGQKLMFCFCFFIFISFFMLVRVPLLLSFF